MSKRRERIRALVERAPTATAGHLIHLMARGGSPHDLMSYFGWDEAELCEHIRMAFR